MRQLINHWKECVEDLIGWEFWIYKNLILLCKSNFQVYKWYIFVLFVTNWAISCYFLFGTLIFHTMNSVSGLQVMKIDKLRFGISTIVNSKVGAFLDFTRFWQKCTWNWYSNGLNQLSQVYKLQNCQRSYNLIMKCRRNIEFKEYSLSSITLYKGLQHYPLENLKVIRFCKIRWRCM